MFENALHDHTTYTQYAQDVETTMMNRETFGRPSGVAVAPAGVHQSRPGTLSWKLFKTEIYEQKKDYKLEVENICIENYRRHVNLANYMIEEPQICHTTDKLRKVCDLFRHMQLRQLPVINPQDGKLVGIITRQDIFAYMTI